MQILLDSANCKIYNITKPFPDQITVKANGNSIVDIRINAIGKPSFKFLFIPDPYVLTAVTLQQPIYGA